MTYDTLSARTALVTGAASGMGAATAALLAAHGARVALLARREDRLTELAGRIGGRALPVTADVTDDESVAAAVRRIHDTYGRIDLAVNSAGVMLPNPVTDGRQDEWTRMLDTNVSGTLRVVRAVTPDLLSAAADGGPADLVNISSIGAHTVFPAYAVYSATKAAVTQLSASLRAELGPRNVRVTNIEPGLTATELGDHIDNDGLTAQLGGMFETLDALTAEDVADLVAYTTSRPRRVNLRQTVILPTGQA
ncbi:putative oxidoreductase [Streptomyces sp. RB5]|uniref:Putative oxidoreductase n=1 Tax=Streptomyces smaragdinus TaxID=2585196 RepID=A0A7K0CLK4_9ACTN|nr:SDR family oxidoreductase [Streptomyces smaragdinus]MQY13634.1 putative oxidoreductase [Streptomyces smaragdinus]